MLQGLQLSAFPSSSPQAELHYYRTVAAQAAYCGDACVFQREMKVKITTYSGDVHPPSSPPPPPRLLPGAGSWATTEEGEREEQDGRSALADSKPSPATTSSPHAGLEASARRVLAFDQNRVEPETCREAGRLPGIG